MPDPTPKSPRLWRRDQHWRNPVWIIKNRGRQIPTYCGDDEAAAKRKLAAYIADPEAYLNWIASHRTTKAIEPPSPLPSAVRMRRMRERRRAVTRPPDTGQTENVCTEMHRYCTETGEQTAILPTKNKRKHQ